MTLEPIASQHQHVFLSYSRHDEAFAQRLKADLEERGHEVWIDTTDIKGGEAWTASITTGINGCHTLITLVSEQANQSVWVQREYLYAEYKAKHIIPVWTEICDIPIYIINRNIIKGYDTHYAAMLSRVLSELEQHRHAAPTTTNPPAPRHAYLDALWLKHRVWLETYTPMAGVARLWDQQRPHVKRRLSAEMVPGFQSLTKVVIATFGGETATREEDFDDIIQAVKQAKQLVVLGEPGAGKSTTLWKLTAEYADLARQDDHAALPVLLRLGGVKIEDDIDEALQGELGAVSLAEALATTGLVLLFDGLNELPLTRREEKVAQIRGYVQQAQAKGWVAVVTCREHDYQDGVDLGIPQQVRISPLDPPRIREFVNKYLPDDGDSLFWQLAGGDRVREVWEVWQKAGATFALFWTLSYVPHTDPDVNSVTTGKQDSIWRQAVYGSRSLLKLARNPYMLFMLTEVFANSGTLPVNRAKLFDLFVRFLLFDREKVSGNVVLDLRGKLSLLAFAMLRDYGTEMKRELTHDFLDERELHLALSASILEGNTTIRFTHQLLQEYFVACHLDGKRDQLAAKYFWSTEDLGQSTVWDEAIILMAGQHQEDCTPVIEWLCDANPDLTIRCIFESGAKIPEATINALQPRWLPRLTDIEGDPDPRARAAVGRGLALLNLDNRRGVGLNAAGLPDIEWVTIDGETEWTYQRRRRSALMSYQIARYPITCQQFRAFVDDSNGAGQTCWYQGMAATQSDRIISNQSFKYNNHPRESVNWYQAMAFCRWLTWRLAMVTRSGLEADILPPDGTLPIVIGVDWADPLTWAVRLPTEQEWERAARGTDARQFPWGDDFMVDYCNNSIDNNNIGMTNTVGIYPRSASPSGVEEVSGNVWEWCLSEYIDPDKLKLDEVVKRPLRGGSWSSLYTLNFRLTSRFKFNPRGKNDNRGFRCVRTHTGKQRMGPSIDFSGRR